MDILADIHNYWRWLILVLLVAAIVNALMKRSGGIYTETDRKLNLFSVMSVEIQVVIGLILYFANKHYIGFQDMDNSVLRFYALEHPLAMIIATGLLSVGRARAKRATEAAKKHSTTLIFYSIGLLIILASIPWPFRGLS
jgi:hypothetical protein